MRTVRPQILVLLLILLAVAVSCESHQERKELRREQTRLRQRQQELQAAITRETAGKPVLTTEETARIGPLWIELRQVEGRLLQVQTRLQELN